MYFLLLSIVGFTFACDCNDFKNPWILEETDFSYLLRLQDDANCFGSIDQLTHPSFDFSNYSHTDKFSNYEIADGVYVPDFHLLTIDNLQPTTCNSSQSLLLEERNYDSLFVVDQIPFVVNGIRLISVSVPKPANISLTINDIQLSKWSTADVTDLVDRHIPQHFSTTDIHVFPYLPTGRIENATLKIGETEHKVEILPENYCKHFKVHLEQSTQREFTFSFPEIIHVGNSASLVIEDTCKEIESYHHTLEFENSFVKHTFTMRSTIADISNLPSGFYNLKVTSVGYCENNLCAKVEKTYHLYRVVLKRWWI